MAELCFLGFATNPERLEHFFLQRRFIDSHATAANLNAVQNNVVSLGPNLGKFLRLKQRHILRFRSSEWMMHGVPFVVLSTPFEERKICNPKKVPVRCARYQSGSDRSRRRMQILHFGDAQS